MQVQAKLRFGWSWGAFSMSQKLRCEGDLGANLTSENQGVRESKGPPRTRVSENQRDCQDAEPQSYSYRLEVAFPRVEPHVAFP